MKIKTITLYKFRNYDEEVIDVQSGINVFFGDNAQGKTNILEAVYLCACARSHRTAKDIDLINKQSDFYKIKIDFVDQQQVEDTLEITYQNAVPGHPDKVRAQRIIHHNGFKLNRVSDMMGLFHAVIFAPEDLMIIKEGPSVRRRYIDLLISQVRPSYFVHLQQYSLLLSQRNKLLKQYRHQNKGHVKPLSDTEKMQIETWDEALAKQAAAIMVQRRLYIERVQQWAAKAQEEISYGKEVLNVRYKSIPGIDHNNSEDELISQINNKLKTILNDDIDKGVTTIGPHRDDIEISLNDEQIKPYASQGQQRSAVLALKIAELHILKEDIGESPVLLLDDVMSELDENRRAALLNHIDDAQIFVTCTDASHISESLSLSREYNNFNKVKKAYSNEIPGDGETSQSTNNHRSFTYFHVSDGHIMPR